ncbi:protein STRUBBELIG-RECEPTOR FAMILY 2-like [Trifolium pratense]|uniref:protein STRUBBELIG-RECEPTOR FAMILY 2-like n=1 Tax=Trifolium pratense TaxID=57577 RepID=UPI001E698138|nr:protein STRUBBELIG-RECEPTOR FAMILY 2-like [Trifolium pratense]
MIRSFLYVVLNLVVFLSIFISQSLALTRSPEVWALQDLYRSLNYSEALRGWNGSDPCEESWTGVACSGSSVIQLKIQGLNLTGSLCRLYNLRNLKLLDVSSNNIVGELPFGLPPNVTHMNLSHNFLIGPIGDIFTGLDNLKEMDLSYNNLSGDLPRSFGSLTNLARLFLQNNTFTGSVTYLSELPLTDLNIQDNLFSGLLPHHFSYIKNLWIGGNKFHATDNSPPWTSPVETFSVEHNISPPRPPTTNTNAIKNYAPPKVSEHKHKKKQLGPGGIAFMVGGGTLVATGIGLLVAIHLNKLRAQSQNLNHSESNDISLHSHPTSASIVVSSSELDDVPLLPPVDVAPLLGPMRFLYPRHNNVEEASRRSFSKRVRSNGRTKIYTIGELQLATNYFNEGNLLGEGSLGPVYKAKFPDGKILAVKIINMAGLSYREEEKFLDVICTASKLKHPNIIQLNGYCLEHGEHLLVYDYFGNLTLYDALHGGACEPLSWVQRLQIALAVAQALDYLHSACCPPVAHGNLKAANVLLDENLMPHICDSSLAILRPLVKSNQVKIPATETTIAERGYIPPDHGQTGFSRRRDVFAFGVLLMELLTGRKPFDGARPREEQYLVKWASPRLCESTSLEKIVDPSMKTTFSSKVLSHYADIIYLCIQPSKQHRPSMSEVVSSLISFSQNFNFAKSGVADATELLEKSFRSANTGFISSPTASHLSA